MSQWRRRWEEYDGLVLAIQVPRLPVGRVQGKDSPDLLVVGKLRGKGSSGRACHLRSLTNRKRHRGGSCGMACFVVWCVSFCFSGTEFLSSVGVLYL